MKVFLVLCENSQRSSPGLKSRDNSGPCFLVEVGPGEGKVNPWGVVPRETLGRVSDLMYKKKKVRSNEGMCQGLQLQTACRKAWRVLRTPSLSAHLHSQRTVVGSKAVKHGMHIMPQNAWNIASLV